MTNDINKWFAASVFVALMTGIADAQVDGALDAGYPEDPLAIQDTSTSFGDNDDPDVLVSNGSELDVLHAYVTATDLHVFVGGNLGNNFEKFEFFIDAFDGGQNAVRFDNADINLRGGTALAMGDMYLTDAQGSEIRVAFTFAYTQDLSHLI